MEFLIIIPSWPTRWDLTASLRGYQINKGWVCVKCVCGTVALCAWHCIALGFYSRVIWAIHRPRRHLFLPLHHLWTDRKWSTVLPQPKSWPAKPLLWVSTHKGPRWADRLCFHNLKMGAENGRRHSYILTLFSCCSLQGPGPKAAACSI